MISAIRESLGWQLDAFSQSLQEGYHRESPDSNFAHYVFYQANSQIPFTVANDIDVASLESSRLNQAPTIAAVGYGLACGRQFSESFLEIWSDGLTRLSGREAFPSDRASFFYRPTELLGIVLGVSHHYKNQPNKSEWLQKILVEGEQRLTHIDLWTYLLSAYAANILSINWKSKSQPASEMSLDELALAKWLCIVDSNFSNRFGIIQIEQAINKTLLENCIKSSDLMHSASHTALRHFSLKTTMNQAFQLCWNNVEQVHCNPHAAIEWLSNSCNNIHTVTQHLQSYLSRESTPDTLNVLTMKTLMKLLARLHSDISSVESEISQQIRMSSSLFIGVNQGNVNTGDYVTMNRNQDESVTNKTEIGANANIGFINSGSGTVSNFSQNIDQNNDEITRLISSLRNIAQQFPEAQRQEVLVTLDDLQEDISNPEKQKPERIKIRLGRLMAIAGMIAGLVAGAADFSNNVLELSEKLGVQIELNHPSIIQQLPSSLI
jgi:hypothetical protein